VKEPLAFNAKILFEFIDDVLRDEWLDYKDVLLSSKSFLVNSRVMFEFYVPRKESVLWKYDRNWQYYRIKRNGKWSV
jgi:hypothetical protein